MEEKERGWQCPAGGHLPSSRHPQLSGGLGFCSWRLVLGADRCVMGHRSPTRYQDFPTEKHWISPALIHTATSKTPESAWGVAGTWCAAGGV